MNTNEIFTQLKSDGLIDEYQVTTDENIIDVTLMSPDDQNFNKQTIYFINGNEISFGTQIPQSLIFNGELATTKRNELMNYAHISDNTSLAHVFKQVQKFTIQPSEFREQYNAIIKEFITHQDLEKISSLLSSFTGDLFVAIDLSGKILTHSNPFFLDYPTWMKCIEQGYCSELVMDYINQVRAKRAKTNTKTDSKALTMLYCSKIDMHILVSKIIRNKKIIGYYFSLNRSACFHELTYQILPLLTARISADMHNMMNYYQLSEKILQHKLILDSLNGASSKEIDVRSKNLRIESDTLKRVIIIKSIYYQKTSYYDKTLYSSLVSKFGNALLFPWKKSIIILERVQHDGQLSKEFMSKLNSVVKDNNLIAVISNPFCDISKFNMAYEESSLVFDYIHLSDNDYSNDMQRIYYFIDYSLYYLLSEIDDQMILHRICHPALQTLNYFDKENNTNLYQTLKSYTFTGFKKNDTAKQLFVHRNTVNYRIEEIEHLCNINLADNTLLFPLMLSFKISDYLSANTKDYNLI